MREIKFRLRRDNTIVGYEKWYCGCRGEGEWRANPCWLYSEDGKYWEPKQIWHNNKDGYTGLLDKNGKEVWEGDILHSEWHSISLIVTYWISHGQWILVNKIENIEKSGYGELSKFKIAKCCMKVIGSIYENPELIKEI